MNFSDTQFHPEGSLIRMIGIKRFVNNPYSPEIDVTVKTVLNDTVISSVTKVFSVNVDLSKFVIEVSNVSLSQNGVRF